jgi:chemotaxis protein histidine kinase CheA
MPALKEKPTVESVLRMNHACDDARGWAVHYGADYAKAWAECERGDWMIWILVRLQQLKQGSKEHRKLVGCLADIAAEALPIFEKRYPNDKRARDCIETLRRYSKSEATIEDVQEARRGAYAAAYAAYAAAYTASDAAYAAADASAASYAAASDAAASDAAAADAAAASAAASASADASASAAASAARSSSLKRSAEIVRQYYPNPPSIVKFLKRQEKGE